jgi:hypothetical protein
MSLIQLRRGGRTILRLLKHLQGGIESFPEVARSAWTTSKATTSQELDDNRTVSGSQNAGSQFDLNGSVHDAVCRYDVEINERGRAAILIGWADSSISTVGLSDIRISG